MRRYCLALDLRNDPALIDAYKRHHETVWPEVVASIRESGIESMEIYLTGNRLLMIIETSDTFSFEAKSASDQANLKVQEWETLMWKYQQALPTALPGEKWVPMEKIFTLESYSRGVD